MNYLGGLLTREKLGKGVIKSMVILDTSTKSLGKFGIHLIFLKKNRAFKVSFWHCFKCLGPYELKMMLFSLTVFVLEYLLDDEHFSFTI
mgnify:FL=1